MTDQEIEIIKAKLELLLNCTFTITESGDFLEFIHTDYYGDSETQKLNFHKLMEVGKIFGTIDFDIEDTYEEGYEYSEYTKDPDRWIKSYKVAKNRINTGLPWDCEKK